MKPEYRKIIEDTMPYFMDNLTINFDLLCQLRPKEILIDDEIEKILVSINLISCLW